MSHTLGRLWQRNRDIKTTSLCHNRDLGRRRVFGGYLYATICKTIFRYIDPSKIFPSIFYIEIDMFRGDKQLFSVEKFYQQKPNPLRCHTHVWRVCFWIIYVVRFNTEFLIQIYFPGLTSLNSMWLHITSLSPTANSHPFYGIFSGARNLFLYWSIT